MMIAAVGLLYVAEVSLVGAWRWAAVFVGLLTLVPTAGEPSRPTLSHIVAAGLLGAGAALTMSAVLGVLTVLLLVPRNRPRIAAALTLMALGVHLLWWRHVSVVDPQRIPDAVAHVVSMLLGGVAHVTSTAVIIRGRTIRFSMIPFVTVLVPVLVSAVLSRPSLRRVVVATLVAGTVTFVLTTVFSLAGHVHFFSAPWWPLVPLGIGAASAYLFLRQDEAALPFRWGVWAATAAGISIVWQVGFTPTQRPLHIAFDEAHGKWETVEAPFGPEVYGRDTVYNYKLLAQWLGGRHTVSMLKSHWTQLAGDVLVVKMPTEFYGVDEKRAIESFVRSGGLLLAIGDHTNLYGTTSVLNDLLSPYGFEIEADATVPWDGEHYDFHPDWWQRSRYLRGIATIQFQTSATIRAHSPFVLPVIVGDRVVGEDAEYSNERFFGDLHPGPEDRQPPLTMAAERRYGKGRVLVFGDSTIFSTFSLMSPGNSELFQNFVEQGTSGRSWLRGTLAFAVVAAGLFFAGGGRVVFAVALLPLVSALCLSAPFAPELTRYPAEWLEVDGRHSHIELRADPRGAHGPAFDDYSTFFAWIGRTGALPQATRHAYRDPVTPTIVLNPDQPFSRVELDRIDQYVRNGGRLLVLDDPRFAIRSTASVLLERFDITLRVVPGSAGVYDPGPPRLPEHILALPFELLREDRRGLGSARVRGIGVALVPSGTSVSLVDHNGTIIGGQKVVGKGLVAVFLRSVAFSEVVMGDVWVGQEVDPERRRLYQLGFDLVNLIRGKGTP